jgi:endonuclease/exonuclease/phosphatase family metal-dependent hydrolase
VSGSFTLEKARDEVPDRKEGVRVVSWNLWWRYSRWQERREAIVAELRRARPDVCGLQEVWADAGENLAASIADELGMYHVYAPSPAPGKWQRRIGDASVGVGNAVLSRWPIREPEPRRLPAGDEPDEGRTVLHARIEGPSGDVPFFVTHLNSAYGQSGLRQAQVAEIAAFVREKGGAESPGDGFPPILVGDFNAPPDADEVRCLVGKTILPVRGLVLADAWSYARPLEPGWTWDRRNPHVAATFEPDARIDYVFVGPPAGDGRGQVLGAGLVGMEPVGGVWASDHFGVLAVLRGEPKHRDWVSGSHREPTDV